MSEAKTTIVTLICERAVDTNPLCDDNGRLKDDPSVAVVKFPCSGMIQPLMIEAAMKAGASGVIVCGCQIGDCYYREGNKMIRERLLGERPPGLKKTVDRRRVLALWLARPQTGRFLSEAKEFVAQLKTLNTTEPAQPASDNKPAAAATPAPAPAKAATETKPAAESQPAAAESGKKKAKPEDKASESKSE